MRGDLGRAVRAWLVARVAVATIVLGIAVGFFGPAHGHGLTVTPVILGATVLATIASSFAMAVSLQRFARPATVGAILMVLDIGSITATIAMTGGAGSVLAVLYGAIIVASATAVGSRATFVAAGLSLASYGVVGLGMALGYLPHPADQPAAQYVLRGDDLAFAALSNLTAMVVVALLSNWLAEQLQRTGGALERSERTREELSARHDDIVRSIGTGILTMDAEGLITSANPAGAEMLGTAPEAMIGEAITRWFPGLDGSAPVELRHRAEISALHSANEDPFPVGYSLTALRGPEGSSRGRLLAFQDLTEIRRLEAAAREAEQLATLGRIAAGLAHEIRNPLSSISGSVELVRDHATLDDEDARLLGIVLEEVERLDDLVNAMLNVARPRVAQLAPVDVANLARSVCTIASAGIASTAGVRLEVRIEHEGLVAADGDMMRQVLWNLVKNAIQSSPRESTVELVIDARDDGSLSIEVRDQGPGIPEHERERIFEAFHTGRTRGVGLGLALVRQLVQAHRGSIEVHPRVPVGTVFRIELPASAPAKD